MRKINFNALLILVAATLLFTSCTTTNKMMREPNMRVNLVMDDFILSDQVVAEASSTKIVGIDWARLFNIKTGNIEKGSSFMIDFAMIPVVGVVMAGQTANFALYELMEANPGYDVVYYPQYETVTSKPLGVGVIYNKQTVTVKDRLGKLKK